MTESNAVAKFKQELHHALEIFYPGWHKKPRLTSYDLLEANPDTLHTWTSKSGSLPKQRKFTQFLESATQFSLDVKQQLEALFDAALSAQEKGAKESNSEHSGGSQLPNRNTVFVGRSMEFRELFEMLCSANSPTILTLFGLGGMGKTAIATELATQALKQKVFARVVWVKGRGEY